MRQLHLADYIVFMIYFIMVVSYGYYIYHRKKAAKTDSRDFFWLRARLPGGPSALP